MNRETEPIPDDDPLDVRVDDRLLAYREYWDGKRWLIGVYVDLTGGAEVDTFLERREDAKP